MEVGAPVRWGKPPVDLSFFLKKEDFFCIIEMFNNTLRADTTKTITVIQNRIV